jgi:4-amino-4-deoxy-L-arabinose transferase-like glycosyltransferase
VRRAWRGVGPEAAVLALAAGLRLAALGRVPTNPYYDAAVRSMGTSWAAFLSGAFEPGRRVAIDKPPVDLWLQVASTRLLGFDGVGLLLPEALGGIALVAALMWLLRTLLGRGAALAGGLALAVAPSAVIVARSDTMDAVMAALAVAGAAVVARAARSGRRGPLVGAGVLLGLAFEVKLAEALLPVCAAAALWWLIGPPARRPRVVGLGLLGGAFVASALAWLVVVSVVPLHPRPWALGASDGSPWRAALVYNGTARLFGAGGNAPDEDAALVAPVAPARHEAARRGGAVAARGAAARHGAALAREHAAARREAALAREHAAARREAALAREHAAARREAALARRAREHAAAVARRTAPPGPLRLLSAQAHLGRWIGIEAVAALAALAVALALGGARGLGRTARGGLLALVLWLVAGLALCSAMPSLRPRYLACVDPAVAACLGAGVALAVRARPRPARLAGAAALCAVLALPLATAVAAVGHGVQVSGRTGAMPAARVAALSAFLRARTAGAADEVAVSAPSKAGQLIARDARPVLILSDGQGNQLVSPAQLAGAVAGGRVRYALLGDACTANSGNERTGCLPVMRWARAHGVDVSRAAGQPHAGALYALTLRAGAAGACGRTPTSATSPRTAPVAGRFASHRATRGPGRRGARARRASRRCSAARRSRSPLAPVAVDPPSRGSRRCAATGPATGPRCRGSRAASRRRGRPGRPCRGSRAPAAAAGAGMAAASDSRPRPRPRPRGARTARSPRARSCRRRSTLR